MQTTDNTRKTPVQPNFRRSLSHGTIVFLAFSFFYIIFFSPVLFSEKLLGPADGISYFIPAFYSIKSLWTDLIFCGYPLAADPQNMTWYPPALILSLIPNSWNAFVILAYVLAGCFTYCYVYTLTKSKLASTVSGIVYSMSGFMIGHLPMVAMIHAAAWMPLIICALEKLRHRFERSWFTVGVLAVTCGFLAGHPQISAYAIGMGVFYGVFMGWSAPIGRRKYYLLLLTVIVLGISLCAIQLIPAVELSRLGLRAKLPYESFISHSLPVSQSLQLLFPFLFGGYTGATTTYLPYWGESVLAEIQGYVGLLPLMLAGIGAAAYPNRSIVRFWFWVGLITLLMVFGDAFFLGGKFLYHVPIYNQFRIQSRHFVELALAVGVLSGLGVSSIQQKLASWQLIRRAVLISFTVMVFCLFSMAVFYPYFQTRANKVGITQLSLFPWANAAVGIPLLIFALGAIAIILFSRWNYSRWSSLVLVIVVLLDISSLGTNWDDWQVYAPHLQRLEPSLRVKAYRDSLHGSNQRFLDIDGVSSDVWDSNGIFPNLTKLWGLPNAGGYSPLMLTRFSEMMKMAANGRVSGIPVTASEHQFDLMSVRYLLEPPNGMTPQDGLVWADSELNIALGSGACAPSAESTEYTLDLSNHPYQATTIAITSSLGCSVEIPNNAELLDIRVVDADGSIETHSFLAGRDTSEYAHDCPDVKPFIQHQRAMVFKSAPSTRPNGEVCQTHSYVSEIQLSRPQQIRRIELNWEKLPAFININHVSLIHGSDATSLPITLPGISPKWKKIEDLESGIIYENQDVLPRVWLVPESLSLQPEEILAAIHTSQLPDGQIFDPKMMALVEDSAATLESSALQPTDYANVLTITETQVELETQTAAPAFLVLSDVFYPGWKAMIDDQLTPIFQTNYVQRGIKLPPGKHMVRLDFQPLSFKVGAGITVASFFGFVYLLWRGRKFIHC